MSATETLTPEQIDAINQAKRVWYQRGFPEKTAKLDAHLANGTLPDPSLLYFGTIRPEKAVTHAFSDDDIPPRYGPGSSTKKWQDFLITFTTMDEGVVKSLSRDDCIRIAEEKGIIPPLVGDKKEQG